MKLGPSLTISRPHHEKSHFNTTEDRGENWVRSKRQAKAEKDRITASAPGLLGMK